MLCDLHAHTTRCGHATGTMRAYVERALALGLTEFGFSEHSPWMIQRQGQHSTMAREELPGYVAEVQALDRAYRRGGTRPFRVRLGLEMDFVPSRLAEARATAAAWPWDYLIGSVHHLGFWCLPDPADRDYHTRQSIEDTAALYFEQVGYMVRERFCDVVAHLDVIKRFGHARGLDLRPWVEPLVPLLRAQGVAVEINTSGLDHETAEPYPGWELIDLLHAGGVALLLNSDAHAPEQVGRHFPAVLAELRRRGITRLTRYERREAVSYPIV